jgi:hypothetical protein
MDSTVQNTLFIGQGARDQDTVAMETRAQRLCSGMSMVCD